ncbi:hypothetical protein HMPREF1093_01347 [Hungatella hathewayi 12489931]|uniref:DUF4143 domain-containing protein n=1 Tax=Hungatella hathewayi TaxID=154046 RepID=A0A3E3DBA1_9FIRM|nr:MULTISPECIES: hypothetical protein [Hungatella]ENY98181.1 hypothetical protein HMPREF1093_01347 [Hungatella hathewayi 12489931]RGD66521.1 hypothetical protein DWX31_32115 [Hungatella hathewayi]
MKRDYRTQNVCVRQSRFIFMVSIHSFYTNDRGSCEIDFLVDNGETVVPLEVKEEVNLRAKSLKTYREKFLPELALRVSMADYRAEERLLNLPLFAVGEMEGVIRENRKHKDKEGSM